MRSGVTVQTFGILLTLAGFLIIVVASPGDHVNIGRSPAQNIVLRQASGSAPANTSPAAAASTTPSQVQTTQQAPSTSAAPAASSAQPQSSAQQPSTTQQQQPSSQTQATSASNNKPSTSSNAAAPTTVTSALVTTNQGGQVVTSMVIVTDTPSPSASSSQSSSNSSGNGSGSGGSSVSSSTIIGLSVAGGVAVLCVVGFFVWKFSRKRIGDYDNNEEIRWPELNAHDTGVPLPTHRTGGAGFDTAPDAQRSSIGYAPSTAANSTAELPPDPYAIPPLPHLDPNQPYRDDPNSAFYDPYHGPVPPTFSPAGEVIPMTQLAGAGRRSPGPGAAYAGDFVSGRVSPAPGMHAAYGSNDYGGRASPGLRIAQQGRSMSPGPQAAYGNYNPR